MKRPKTLTAVSIFSGCGGFDLGASRAGVKIVWANDINPHAAAAYRSLLPDVPFHLGDIRAVKSFPHADILIGCYPCTGFSEAAKRRTSADEESRDLRLNHGNYLYREFLRAIRIVQPHFLFVENVRGMLSASNGWFLERQLDGFRRHGFKVSSKLLVASDYGVPQERRRVFLVGVHKDVKDFKYEFPPPSHGPGAPHPWRSIRSVLRTLRKCDDDAHCSTPFHGHYLTRPRKKKWSDVSYTIVAHAGHVPLHPSGKLMMRTGPDQYALRGNVNRRLSWRECAALQSLPETIATTGSLAGNYRVIGNAVPPPVAEALLRPITQRFGTTLSSQV